MLRVLYELSVGGIPDPKVTPFWYLAARWPVMTMLVKISR
jgi:hypothetical protein